MIQGANPERQQPTKKKRQKHENISKDASTKPECATTNRLTQTRCEILSPDLEQSIPRTSGQRLAIIADAQAADTVVVTHELLNQTAQLSVPSVTIVVIIASKQKLASLGEGHAGNAAEDLVVGVLVDLSVGADIEETAGRVIRAGADSIAIGEELNGVDIRFVAVEGLDTRLVDTMIPQLGGGITRTRHKLTLGVHHGNAHDITGVIGEDALGSLGFNVPQYTSGVARGGDDLGITDETAARQVALVMSQLRIGLLRQVVVLAVGQAIDGAEVIEAAARHEVARGRIGASHDPRRAQGNGMDFIGGESVPNNELSVLRGRDQMARVVAGPVHGVDLAEVALQNATLLHANRHLLHVAPTGSIGQGIAMNIRVNFLLFDAVLELLNALLTLVDLRFVGHLA